MNNATDPIVEIPLDCLHPHAMNANVMTAAARAKLKAHIGRTGRYPPVIVREVREVNSGQCVVNSEEKDKAATGAPSSPPTIHHPQSTAPATHYPLPISYEILDGHHRVEILRQLKYATARCVAWDVDDAEALLLLTTLNRLQGQDDPRKRAALLAELARKAGVEMRKLAKQLPDTAMELTRLRRLIQPAVRLARAPKLEDMPVAIHFFLRPAQGRAVEQRLREIGGKREEALLRALGLAGMSNAPGGECRMSK